MKRITRIEANIHLIIAYQTRWSDKRILMPIIVLEINIKFLVNNNNSYYYIVSNHQVNIDKVILTCLNKHIDGPLILKSFSLKNEEKNLVKINAIILRFIL